MKGAKNTKKKRSVNLEKLAPQQAEQLGEELGKQLGLIAKEAEEKANKLAQVYGIKVVMALQLVDPKTNNLLTT
jgi:hypothetical protein